MAIFTCKNCGSPFEAKASKKPAHCSMACKKATGLKKRMRTCQQCGKEFEVNTSAKEGKYCSQTCTGESQRLLVAYACTQCGKEFMDRPSAKRKVCSRKCFTDSMIGHTFNRGRRHEGSPRPERAVLTKLYVTQELSAASIGAIFGVQAQTVRKWLADEGIRVRQTQLVSNLGKEPKNKIPVPPKQDLTDLYLDQALSTAEIGLIYGVSSKVVIGWVKLYGMPVGRLNKKLYERGLQFPTKDELSDMIHGQRLSYAQVAAKYGVDQSLVPTWLDKYGIDRHETWHNLHNNPTDVAAMRALYDEGLSLTEIGQMYGVGKGPVKLLFLANGVEIKKDGWQGKRFETKRGELVRSTYERRVADWLYDQGIDYDYEPPLPFSNHGSADFFANGWYIEIWGVIGSKEYAARRDAKRTGYTLSGVPLIEIPAHGFDQDRNDLWIRRLQHVLASPNPNP